MILGVGSDLANISRIEETISIFGERFLKRSFAPVEFAEIKKRQAISNKEYACTLAKRFAAKEAFVKAVGTGLRGGRLTEIEVINDALGRPQLVLYGYFKDYAKGLGTEKIHLTLSHTKELAMAQVILEG